MVHPSAYDWLSVAVSSEISFCVASQHRYIPSQINLLLEISAFQSRLSAYWFHTAESILQLAAHSMSQELSYPFRILGRNSIYELHRKSMSFRN
jgi:hypothetical protein